MAVQLRNTLFDPSNATQISNLDTILTQSNSVVACVKRAGRPKSHVNIILYEIMMIEGNVRLEVSGDNDAADITTLETTIKAYTGNLIVDREDGWDIGTDQDLRAS